MFTIAFLIAGITFLITEIPAYKERIILKGRQFLYALLYTFLTPILLYYLLSATIGQGIFNLIVKSAFFTIFFTDALY